MDVDTAAKLAAPIITLIIGAIIKHYTTARPKVISYIGHISSFNVTGDNPFIVNAHSVIVRNTGSRAATNVRLSHYVLPQNISVDPPVKYSIDRNPQGVGEIVIPVLVPKEQVTVSYLYFPPITWQQINATTKSDDGLAKVITVIPSPQPNRLILALVWILTFIGASVIVYWITRLLWYAI
jgi:hypothetical protein